MSINVEGEKCPVCTLYLFNEDDVVHCPVCGAPHHRDCYNSVGHCGLEQFHGTDKQYTRKVQEESIPEHAEKPENTVKCGMCGEEYEKNQEYCRHCGASNVSKMGGRYVRFDFLGGVPADMDLGQGVKAEEAKRFVASNTHRYIPKFASMLAGKKASWNWLAFISPCGWFLSRKMYAIGAVLGALSVAFTMMSFPFNKIISQFDITNLNYMQLAQLINDNIATIGKTAVIAAVIGGILNIILSVVSGAFGDYIYRRHSLDTISHIKAESDDIEEEFHRKGGVSMTALLVGLFAVQYLPSLISMFTGL